MLPLAAEKNVICEAMAGLGREIAPLSDLRALVGLHRLMRAWRPAIVHTHTAKAGLVGRLAARAASVPTVVHTYHGHVLRGYFSPAKTALFRRLETWLAASADALVAVSESVKQDLVDLGIASADKIRVVPLGLDLAHLAAGLPRGVLRREAGITETAPLVGMVGRLVPIKDAPTFLRAARLVAAERDDVRFALVGDGEERPALESLCRELGLDGKGDVLRLEARPRRGLRRPRRGGERLAQRGDAGRAHRGAGGGAAGGGDPRGRDAGPPRRGRARAARPSGGAGSPRPRPSWRRSISPRPRAVARRPVGSTSSRATRRTGWSATWTRSTASCARRRRRPDRHRDDRVHPHRRPRRRLRPVRRPRAGGGVARAPPRRDGRARAAQGPRGADARASAGSPSGPRSRIVVLAGYFGVAGPSRGLSLGRDASRRPGGHAAGGLPRRGEARGHAPRRGPRVRGGPPRRRARQPLQGRPQARRPGPRRRRPRGGRDPHRLPLLRRPQRGPHPRVGGGHHELVQPARQHGRALRRRRLRGLAGAARQRLGPRRVLHQPRPRRAHGEPPRLPRLQLAPGLDLPRGLREPLHRLHPRRADPRPAVRLPRVLHPLPRPDAGAGPGPAHPRHRDGDLHPDP